MSITIHPLLQLVVVGMFLAVPSLTSATESQCFGTVGNGHIEGSEGTAKNIPTTTSWSSGWIVIDIGLLSLAECVRRSPNPVGRKMR